MELRAQAESLMLGLRELRARGRLCDVLLTTGDAEKAGEHVAHQVMLAAVSKPLRDYLVGAKGADEAEVSQVGLTPAPKPQELQIAGLSDAGPALETALRFVYGGSADAGDGAAPGSADNKGQAAKQDLANLAAAWSLPSLASAGTGGGRGGGTAAPGSPAVEDVLVGMRQLRASGTLCDIVVTAGGQKFAAHQAVLAACSEPLRKYIMDKLRELVEAADLSAPKDGGERRSPVASHAVALDLEGVTHGEALGHVLDFLYGELTPRQPSSAAVLQEVRQLATSLELPLLQTSAAKWTVKPKPVAATKPPVSAVQPVASGGNKPQVPATHDEASEEQPREEQAEEAADSKETQLEQALYALQFCRFATTDEVPSKSSITREPQSKQDVRLLEKLREAFDERPVWLDRALLKRLPASCDEEVMTRLLPFVAYQWEDGPWSKGFTRLGWDPRENAQEALPLQVIQFRDPHWKQHDENSGPADCTFKRPPSQKTQAYQYTDIQDDFVSSMIASSDLEGECAKKTGWIPPFVIDAIRDRLSLKSHQLREKLAAKAATMAAAARGKKRLAPASGGRKVAKKTRAGGG